MCCKCARFGTAPHILMAPYRRPWSWLYGLQIGKVELLDPFKVDVSEVFEMSIDPPSSECAC